MNKKLKEFEKLKKESKTRLLEDKEGKRLLELGKKLGKDPWGRKYTTITVSKQTKEALKKLKEIFDVNSIDEIIRIFTKEYIDNMIQTIEFGMTAPKLQHLKPNMQKRLEQWKTAFKILYDNKVTYEEYKALLKKAESIKL